MQTQNPGGPYSVDDGTAEGFLIEEQQGELTPREREVVDLVAAGSTQKAVAARLGIGRRQVERLLEQARAKKGARSTTHLCVVVNGGNPLLSDGRPSEQDS